MTTTRQVLVRYFAAASEAAGKEEETLDLQPDATLASLRTLLLSTYGPALAAAIANGSFLVDGVAVTASDGPLGRQVDVLPPFAGG